MFSLAIFETAWFTSFRWLDSERNIMINKSSHKEKRQGKLNWNEIFYDLVCDLKVSQTKRK